LSVILIFIAIIIIIIIKHISLKISNVLLRNGQQVITE